MHCRPLALSLIALVMLSFASQALAQVPAPQASPEDYGLEINARGKVSPGDDRRGVVIPREGEDPVVAKVYCQVGDRYVMLLPDGRLTSVAESACTLTDRPFTPISKRQLGLAMKEKFPGFNVRETARYLYVYNTSQPFYQTTSRILETMFPALQTYCRTAKLPAREPDAPLVVIMFRTEDEFQNFRPMPDGVVAYYNAVSNQVVMYEQSRLAEIAPELAVKQAISTIAHEGVHQILHNIGVQRRLSNWPIWISEGLAEYFAPTTLDRRVRWKGIGLPQDLRMKELDELFKSENAPVNGEFLKGVVTASQLDSTGYAGAWALTHYLAERRKAQFLAYLERISQLGELETLSAKENLEIFTQHFGEDFRKLEIDVIQHLQSLPYADPVLTMTYYVGMMQVKQGDSIGRATVITSSPAGIQKWQSQALFQLPPEQRSSATFNVQAFAGRPAAEQFVRGWLGR